MNADRIGEYLGQMIHAAGQICSYVEGLDKSDFLADRRTQDAVVLNLIVLGESATRLLKEYPEFAERHPTVPWRAMKGMRNRIAHGYFEINLDVVWDTVATAIPQLMQSLPQIRRPFDTK